MTPARLVTLAVVCLAGAELGFIARNDAEAWGIPALWPPAGLILAGILSAPARGWVAALVGAAAVVVAKGLMHQDPPLATMAVGLVTGLEAFAAAVLLRRILGEDPLALDRPEHIWKLCAVAAGAPLAGGLVAGTLLSLVAGTPLGGAWLAWWLASAVGILMTTPIAYAALTGDGPFMPTRAPLHHAEFGVLLAGTGVVSVGVFGDFFPEVLQAPAYVLPFILWSVFRFGPGGTAATVFTVTLTGLLGTAHGLGPFVSPDDPGPWVHRAQGVGAIIGLSFLLLASIVAERKRSAQERAALVADLQQALAEVKTLEGFIPICAWCHKVRDDSGFWQGIENYLQDRTDATFSHSICPNCTEHWHGTEARPTETVVGRGR